MKSRSPMDAVILVIMERHHYSSWKLGCNYLSLLCMCTPPEAMKQVNASVWLRDLLKS